MGCSNCGTRVDGKPAGCNSNGNCSSGGCNRLNVFDWLSTIPLPDGSKPYNVVEVIFNKGSRKEYFKNIYGLDLNKGAWIVVEGMGGVDVGQVNLTGELVRYQLKKYNVADDGNLKKILRTATELDMESFDVQKAREPFIMTQSRAMAKQLNLEMKIGEVEVQADGKKATFFYTADGRIDFRELIKLFASEFKLKVEMKQIGARQESAKVGGIGSCGRELCCSTWLSDFKSVNTTAARYQNLSINQTKLSGQCGRLKCCLNYELDTYMDALRGFPNDAETLETTNGKAYLQKRDIFKNLMWYSVSGSSKQYPLDIERVREIVVMNKAGEKPADLKPVELEVVTTRRSVTSKEDVGFVNDVGQVSLRSLERSNKKSKQQKPGGRLQDNRQRQAKPQNGQSSNVPPNNQGTGKPNAQRTKSNQPNNSQQKIKQQNSPSNINSAAPENNPSEGAQKKRRPQSSRPNRPPKPKPEN